VQRLKNLRGDYALEELAGTADEIGARLDFRPVGMLDSIFAGVMAIYQLLFGPVLLSIFHRKILIDRRVVFGPIFG